MNFVNVVVGDFYGDGHGMCESKVIKTNLTGPNLHDAYAKGCEIVDIDVVNDYCFRCEDNQLPNSVLFTLRRKGVISHEMHKDIIDNGRTVDPDQWFAIYMGLAKLGKPSMWYDIVEMDTVTTGGYGLFL